MNRTPRLAFVVLASTCLLLTGLRSQPQNEIGVRSATPRGELVPDWRTDPDWHDGKAEWAVYDAKRVIYGKPRRYEATIFTNKQMMDPGTTTKANSSKVDVAFEVFKHNVSEIIPTDNYDYRFLTTTFVRADSLIPYKLVVSTQEDCGATYKQCVFEGVDHGEVAHNTFCYFPGAGENTGKYQLPGMARNFNFHDNLSVTLRDYPFEFGAEPPDDAINGFVNGVQMLKLIPDQTDTHETSFDFAEAKARYIGRETLELPYGAVSAHHLRVEHEPQGGVSESHYWFSAEPGMRHVMVQYRGPWGVEYRLKRLAWWAYWRDSRPK